MGNILEFPKQPPAKFGFRRARRRRDTDDPNQLDLFLRPGKILKLPTGLSPFEEALVRDERGQDGAINLYSKAVEEGDRVSDAYCNLGVLRSQGGQVEEAFDCFRNALVHDQRHWESHYNLGNLYFDKDDYRSARLHYELATQIEPAFRNSFFNLGLVLAIEQEYQPAIEMLSRYREMTPGEEGGATDDLLETLKQSEAKSEG